MTTEQVLRAFAEAFHTQPEAIRYASGPGARHCKRIRWAALDTLARRYASRASCPSNDHGNGYAAREFNLHKSSVLDARKALAVLLASDAEFARKFKIATERCKV